MKNVMINDNNNIFDKTGRVITLLQKFFIPLITMKFIYVFSIPEQNYYSM